MDTVRCFSRYSNEAVLRYGIDGEYAFCIDGRWEYSIYDYVRCNEIMGLVKEWCEDQLGPGGAEHRIWATQGWFVVFWKETDATAFKLCWG